MTDNNTEPELEVIDRENGIIHLETALGSIRVCISEGAKTASSSPLQT